MLHYLPLQQPHKTLSYELKVWPTKVFQGDQAWIAKSAHGLYERCAACVHGQVVGCHSVYDVPNALNCRSTAYQSRECAPLTSLKLLMAAHYDRYSCTLRRAGTSLTSTRHSVFLKILQTIGINVTNQRFGPFACF